MGHSALSATHILQDVFLNLPQQDLLLIQRVCRAWREVIVRSNQLQAALFLCPFKTSAAKQSLDESVRINPLLLSHFPAFFDNTPLFVSSQPSEHGMGPYYTTDWAESIRPWVQFVQFGTEDDDSPYVTDDIPSIPDALVGVPQRLDSRRSAAYRHPEASWRRMLPCLPAPVELQVRYETSNWRPRAGTLRCLQFERGHHPATTHDASYAPIHEDHHPWLTFGLIYDIFEAAWFRGEPARVGRVQFDWTFQKFRPRIPTLGHVGALIPASVDETTNTYLYGEREFMRKTLPDKEIGGTGRVLILLTEYSAQDQDLIDEKKRFRSDFELQKMEVKESLWEEIIPYEVS